MIEDDRMSERSITRIQTALRTLSAAKKSQCLKDFSYFSMPDKKQTTYPALFAGNGSLDYDFLEEKKNDAPFVFIGTSCLQSLKIAINSCAENNTALIHQIYILDTSRFVLQFWRDIKRIFLVSETFKQLQENILMHKEVFFSLSTHDVYMRDIDIPIHNDFQPVSVHYKQSNFHRLQKIIDELILCVGFTALKQLVLSVNVLAYDWANHQGNFFDSIKHYCDLNKYQVVVYCSNILSVLTNQPAINHFVTNLSRLDANRIYMQDMKYITFFDLCGGRYKQGVPDKMVVITDIRSDASQSLISSFNESYAASAYEKRRVIDTTINQNLQHAIYYLRSEDRLNFLSYAKTAYKAYSKVISTGNLAEYFNLHCIFGRILGIAMILNAQAEGAQYLIKAVDTLEDYFGDCVVVDDLKEEVSRLINTVIMPVCAN